MIVLGGDQAPVLGTVNAPPLWTSGTVNAVALWTAFAARLYDARRPNGDVPRPEAAAIVMSRLIDNTSVLILGGYGASPPYKEASLCTASRLKRRRFEPTLGCGHGRSCLPALQRGVALHRIAAEAASL